MVTATARLEITLNSLPLLATAGVNKAEKHGVALKIDFGICSPSSALGLSTYSVPNTTTTLESTMPYPGTPPSPHLDLKSVTGA